jgi:tRNA A58 N-methylase Trm61
MLHVNPRRHLRDEIAELIAGATTCSLLNHFEQVARLAVRLVMQSALEAEVTELLGRDRYQRGERVQPAPATATHRCRSRPPPGR